MSQSLLLLFPLSVHYRVIAVLHFNRQKLYIRDVLTHAAYDRWCKTYRSNKP